MWCADGAHAADALGDARHLLHRAAFAELFKAAQLGDDHVGIFQTALLIQEQVNAPMPFQAGDRVNGDLLRLRFFLRHASWSLTAVLPYFKSLKGMESARPKR